MSDWVSQLDEIRRIKADRDYWKAQILTYIIEIQKANKGIARLNKKIERLENKEYK